MKARIKAWLADLVYGLYEKRIFKNHIRVMSIDETLDELLSTDKSLVRFGDGEIIMIRGKSLYFQEKSDEIARRLADILQYREEGLMVAVPDIFDGVSQYRASGQKFWKDHLLFFRSVYRQYCNPDRIYGNAYVSRCYYNYEDKSRSAGWFLKIRRLWQERDIVVVEGAGTHNGVENDLLSNAKSVKRILCPVSNAGDKLTQIHRACLDMPADSLFLVSIGPAAKLLAQDLYHDGRRVIDIGNLDMEYEWFLQKAKEKIKLQKHAVLGENANREAGFGSYWDEVVKVIE